MKRFIRNNGLSVVLLGMFVFLWWGQSLVGHRHYNEERQQHQLPEVSYTEYLSSDHFWEATTENWESEFLQMFMYIVLTVSLFQKGSSESKDPDDPEEEAPPITRDSPWPARKGGWWLRLYEHSLSTVFLIIFLISFFLHAVAGAKSHNEEQQVHGEAAVSTLSYMKTSQFWFESLQNWQSEFLAIAAMVILSIFFREKGSPESKPVQTPYFQHAD